ncbi:hypothetical protein MAP00_002327 [Monascus purpureus]|nr:hypothetical protein MAP00_002327 [Monascus purpureus]
MKRLCSLTSFRSRTLYRHNHDFSTGRTGVFLGSPFNSLRTLSALPLKTTHTYTSNTCRRGIAIMPLERSHDPLVWIDCEMTGLDPQKDEILQICCFITDSNLNLLDPHGFEAVIHHPQSTLAAMSQWCIDTHGRTGLTASVLASMTTPEEASRELLAYIQKYVPEPRRALLAGNSVHADKAFLAREPYARVLEWLHYRILDVSSFKEGARRWGGAGLLEDVPGKKLVHLARDDILESIEEMRFYRDRLFGK